MKLINEKGKIFGLINIIDLCVLLIIAVVIAGGFRLFGDRWANVKTNGTVTVKLEVANVRGESVDAMTVGDTLSFYDDNLYFGKIVSKEPRPYIETIQTENNELVETESPNKYNVDLYVECDAYITDDVVVIGKQPTRIGNQFTLKNRTISVIGTIMKVDINQK